MMRFVVDAMLGKVALWLRLAGNDTFYSPTLDDDVALEMAEEEDRTLLTSDEELHQRAKERGLRSMLVRGSVDERVARVFRAYKIEPRIDPHKSRCSKCNGELEVIDKGHKARIQHLVHQGTFEYYDTFWLCNDCESVFFQGGYWENIVKYMKRIEMMIDDMGD